MSARVVAKHNKIAVRGSNEVYERITKEYFEKLEKDRKEFYKEICG